MSCYSIVFNPRSKWTAMKQYSTARSYISGIAKRVCVHMQKRKMRSVRFAGSSQKQWFQLARSLSRLRVDHMTGACYITRRAKNITAERCMSVGYQARTDSRLSRAGVWTNRAGGRPGKFQNRGRQRLCSIHFHKLTHANRLHWNSRILNLN